MSLNVSYLWLACYIRWATLASAVVDSSHRICITENVIPHNDEIGESPDSEPGTLLRELELYFSAPKRAECNFVRNRLTITLNIPIEEKYEAIDTGTKATHNTIKHAVPASVGSI